MTDWRMRGIDFAACNCEWGCPCQFNALPSHGHCTGGLTVRIEEGYFGASRLDGVVWGMWCQWPGPVHEGNGRMLVYVDERAAPDQRDAIVEITHGRHSEEGTFFQIFSAVCPTKEPPVFAPVEFEVDRATRRARLRVPGVLDITAEPIRNPVTGAPHYPRIVLPNGFEFKEADFASATIGGAGPLAVSTHASHAHFAEIHLGPNGFIE